MALTRGTRFGTFEIVAAIGAGGMGEVYKAHDTRLNRDVALKVLPERFAADPNRLARFKREALLLASLNDSHIAAIHGLEESDGIRALVMEFVEGETLQDRIRRPEALRLRSGESGSASGLSVNETLAIARQVIGGLEAAHAKGIVHRDLKPANIKVRADGAVKVLDFGLAKAVADIVAADLTTSPTMTGGATIAGTIIGTASYMSPEQARGRDVDKRADIWAFGCVLYEMLTGRIAFPGETVTDALAAVLER